MKVYYITRSYLPSYTGGTLIRAKYVELLKQNGLEVEVLTVNYNNNSYYVSEVNGIIVRYFPHNLNLRFGMCLERIGIVEDYLDYWVKVVIRYMKQEVKSEDVVFCTSGGELASIKIGSILKKRTNCKFVINFHDPIDYTLVNGLKIDNRFHVSREKTERKYISGADLIITSSDTLRKSLAKKYNELSMKIKNSYFGYLDYYNEHKTKEYDGILKIVYGGNFGTLQCPEIFAKAASEFEDVHVYFVGNSSRYIPIHRYKNEKYVHFYDYMPYDEYCRFVSNEMDCGCVSLVSDYLGACVPSKVYEFINLSTPMIACLPDGDAKDLVDKNKYGLSCLYFDFDALCTIIKRLKNKDTINGFRDKINRDKHKWAMSELIKPIVRLINEI